MEIYRQLPRHSQKRRTAVYSSMSYSKSTKPTILGAIPWTWEWILGFATAALLLEIFFIDADRKGLLIVGGLFHAETQNMPGGCIVTSHCPLIELLAGGVLFTTIYRVLRLFAVQGVLSRERVDSPQ